MRPARRTSSTAAHGYTDGSKPPVASLISLGCSKNVVDSEHILAHLVQNGFLLTEDPSQADICLVNTCAFIDEARRETAEVLESLRSGDEHIIIVALGCMPARVKSAPELAHFLRAADATVSFADYPRLGQICRDLIQRNQREHLIAVHGKRAMGEPPRPPSPFLRWLDDSPRLRIGSPHTAYVKISEGCSNRCRFCSISLIRGRQVSRPEKSILREVQQLIAAGARELNLIAQDTTSYGRDLGRHNGLSHLLTRLAKQDNSVWYRVLYAHPRHLTDELLGLLSSLPCLCPYLDIPLQHVSDRMLLAMGRGMTRSATLKCVEKARAALAHGALRTTFIVGFPGETDEDFAQLLELVRQGIFDHIGVFTYSPEPGTPAAHMPDMVPPSVKESRRDELMHTQQHIRRKKLKERRGQTLEVILDEIVSDDRRPLCPRGTCAIGRTQMDAPEVDGVVYIRGSMHAKHPGDRLRVTIVDSQDYDLIGYVVE